MHSRVFFYSFDEDTEREDCEIPDETEVFDNCPPGTDYVKYSDYKKDVDCLLEQLKLPLERIKLKLSEDIISFEVTEAIKERLRECKGKIIAEVTELLEQTTESSGSDMFYRISSSAYERYGYQFYSEDDGMNNELNFLETLSHNIGKRIYILKTYDYHF